MKQILMGFLVLGLGSTVAEASTLRVTCDDSAAGAEISINGKYKGECPIDIQVNEGKNSLKAVKKIDGKDTVFKDEVRVGDGVTKRVEVTFGASAGASAPATAIRVDQNAVAQQRYEIEMAEYNRSIQSCLPKHAVELNKRKQAVKDMWRAKWAECRDSQIARGYEEKVLSHCGTSTWNGDVNNAFYDIYVSGSSEGDALNGFEYEQQEWCEKQFTKPNAPQQSEATKIREAASRPTGFVSQGGLTWMPVNFSTKKWSDANIYCTNTAINGQTGWRLPTKDELQALYDSGTMKGQGWTLGSTWSSMPDSVGWHYYVSLDYGNVGSSSGEYENRLTCVR